MWKVVEKEDKGQTRVSHYHFIPKDAILAEDESLPSWYNNDPPTLKVEHEIIDSGFGCRMTICKECKKIWIFLKKRNA